MAHRSGGDASEVKSGHDIRIAHAGKDLVGECPTWNVAEQAIYWVDTRCPSLQRLSADTLHRSWTMSTGIGSFAFRKNGGLVAGMQNGFCTIELDSGTVTSLVDPEPTMPDNRLNDGKCDNFGRFWCGSRGDILRLRREPS